MALRTTFRVVALQLASRAIWTNSPTKQICKVSSRNRYLLRSTLRSNLFPSRVRRVESIPYVLALILSVDGTNPQDPADAGVEGAFVSKLSCAKLLSCSHEQKTANLDTQFLYGLTFPAPKTFYSTAGSPPFIPDSGTPTDTNEPYTSVRFYSWSWKYDQLLCYYTVSGLISFWLRKHSLKQSRPVTEMMNRLVRS